MDPSRWRRITEVFDEVVERPPEERAQFLEEACAGDAALRSEVGALLRSFEDDPNFLESPAARETPVSARAAAAAVAMTAATADPLEGALVGRYRVERRIGAGGMGAVYLARREGDFEHAAAIKVLRRGLDTEQILERFRSERQILAALHHPNVAHLLDGGMTGDGRPYFAMEYIDGEPIDSYCESRGLGLRERVELFITVCRAVHHAHQNLVVHRDLKPSNILVTRDGLAKLLDFGIAKIFDPERGEAALTVTRPEGRAFTPEYASPEQARGEAITTATDVYSLGVLLYELVAGERPYRVRAATPTPTPRPAPGGTAQSATAHGPPPPPSAVGSRWRAQLRGDLDTIVLKAMHLESERRYASAEAFAEDLERYLRGLPVAAQKDSLGYRARRFIARHRLGVATAAAFLALLVAAIVVTMLQSRRVATAQRRAEAERATAEQVVRVLVDLFERSNPAVYPGGDTTTVATLIDVGEEKVEALSSEPQLQARLWNVLADIHIARSRYDRARALFERALENERNADGAWQSDTLETLHGIARIRAITESPQATLPLMRQIVDAMTKVYPPSDPRLVAAKQDLAAASTDDREKERLFEEVLTALRAATPRNDVAIASALNQLGMHYYRRDGARARQLFEEALGLLEPILPPDHPHRLGVEKNLGSVLAHLGEWEAAESRARAVLEQSRRVLGPRSKRVGGALELLGESLANQGRHAEAESTYREVVEIFTAVIGADNWRVGSNMANLAQTMALQGRYAEAEALQRRAIAVLEQSDSARSRAAMARAHLALSVAAQGRLGDASAEARTARRAIEALGDAAEPSAVAQVDLAAAQIAIEVSASHGAPDLSLPEAEALLRAALAIRREMFPAGHPAIAEVECALAAALAEQGRREEASTLLRDAFPKYRAWGLAQSSIVRRVEPIVASLAG